jgi:hypothetical protein
MMNWKGFGRKRSCRSGRITSAFAWSGSERPQTTSFRVACVLSEIRTEHLPNTSLERYRYANPLSKANVNVSYNEEIGWLGEFYLLGYECQPTFQKNMSSNFRVEQKSKARKQQLCLVPTCLFHAAFLFFGPEDGGDMLLRNICEKLGSTRRFGLTCSLGRSCGTPACHWSTRHTRTDRGITQRWRRDAYDCSLLLRKRTPPPPPHPHLP